MKKTINYSKTLKENSFYFRQEKNLTRLRRLYKHKVGLLNTKYNDIFDNLKNFKLKIFIRIRPNNIFCTLKNLKTNKIILNKSSGLYELQTSKKRVFEANWGFLLLPPAPGGAFGSRLGGVLHGGKSACGFVSLI